MNNIKLIATDLDGTFLKNDKTVSPENLKALKWLGEQNIIRVAATGRNLKKVKDVIGDHIPFDYVVYSSGAGVVNLKTGETLFNQNLARDSVKKLLNYFVNQKLNFHAFFPTPENHKHWFFRGDNYCEEFERYFNFNSAFAYQLNVDDFPETELCQFLVMIPEDEQRFLKMSNEIETLCSEIRVIRASSPITKGYIWIEIFHHLVSKGNGIKHICDELDINYENTVSIGNDYNDFDLLEFTNYSFLTANSPKEIKGMYTVAPSNEDDAFAWVTQLIKI
jgi:Cof subfamily protein (haloacid dehalogenase superfamily)